MKVVAKHKYMELEISKTGAIPGQSSISSTDFTRNLQQPYSSVDCRHDVPRLPLSSA